MNSPVSCLKGHRPIAHKLKTSTRNGVLNLLLLETSVLKGNLLVLLKAAADFQMSRVIGYKTGVQFQSRNENDGVALQ